MSLAMIGRPLPGAPVSTVQNARDFFRFSSLDGVVSGRLGELDATHLGGLDVEIDSGHARLSGLTGERAESGIVTASPGDNDNDRIDRLVAQLDPTANNGQGSIEIVIKEGTPDSDPQPPSITQTLTGVYEIRLWRWTVEAQASVISSLIDERNLIQPITGDSVLPSGRLGKPDPSQPAIDVTGAGTAEIRAGVTFRGVDISGPISMPSLAAGTDYFVYANGGATQAVDASGVWPNPVGSPPSGELIGGFHYAPGGVAGGFDSGGNTTPAINPFSCWDLRWRPKSPDPRGMTFVATGEFWSDIYLMNRDPDQFGTSRNNQPIADGETDGTTTAIIPALAGGNGSTRYASASWWNHAEALACFGKRLPTYDEFAALAFGVVEEQGRGNDPVTTGLGTTNAGSSNPDQDFTSRWGVIQAAGVQWAWGRHFGGPHGSTSYQAITGGRGSVHSQPNAALFGGAWGTGSDAGSRCAGWTVSPSLSASSGAARGVCDHLQLA